VDEEKVELGLVSKMAAGLKASCAGCELGLTSLWVRGRLATCTSQGGDTGQAMRILTRYILIELGKVFLLSLVTLTGIFCIILVVDKALDQGLPPAQLLRLTPYILPDALRFSVPVTLLLATTNVYARLSGSNEMVAIKSLGIHPMAMLWPALVVAFLLSLGTVVLNDVAVSWGRRGVERVFVEEVEEIAYGMLRTQRRYSHPNFDINVKRVEGRRLIRPTLTIKARGDTPPTTITAEQAIILSDPKENVLRLLPCDVTVVLKGGSVWAPNVREFVLPLGDRDDDPSSKSPSSIALRLIPAETVRQRKEIERYEQELSARAACEMVCGDFRSLVSSEWKARQRTLKSKRSRLDRLQAEPYRRWSAGFSCLCFVLVGAPMAIWLRNRDFLTSFFLCFGPILIVYYPVLAWTLDAAKGGTIPPFAVWAGNVILLLWGAHFLRKVLRY
jgi:lipopolysaccharide export system permease protein